MAFHPLHHAAATPDKPALIMAGSGATLSFGALEAQSNRIAQLLRSLGLARGDTIAILMTNSLDYHPICWAAQRAGLVYVAMSTKLTADEARYILDDSGAKAIFASAGLAAVASEAAAAIPSAARFAVGGAIPAFADFAAAVAAQPATRIADESTGADMLYSSGTTGRPKGVRTSLPTMPIDQPSTLVGLVTMLYGMNADTVYLSPAPLYHAAPLRYTMAALSVGGTVVIMERFDPEAYLAAVERYRATHSQLVPTMFVRMLKLPDDVRARYDLSSLKVAIHAAAPCPVDVKHAMIAWWGPVIYEYYSATEGAGFTAISPAEWLAHPGSVGKSLLGEIRIVGDDGAAWPEPDRPHPLRRRRHLRLSQRSGKDRRDDHRTWCHLWRHRPCRRRRLSLPHRPPVVHDHLGRRQRLSAGSGERAHHAPRCCRRRGVRRPRCRDGRGGEGRRPAA